MVKKGIKDKQRSTTDTHKTKDRITRTPLKAEGELRCSGMVGSSFSTIGKCMWCSWQFNHHIVTLNKDSIRVLNSRDLIEYTQSRSHSSFYSINIFYFSQLPPSPHSKLKEVVQLGFIKKEQRRYKYFVLERDTSCLLKKTL